MTSISCSFPNKMFRLLEMIRHWISEQGHEEITVIHSVKRFSFARTDDFDILTSFFLLSNLLDEGLFLSLLCNQPRLASADSLRREFSRTKLRLLKVVILPECDVRCSWALYSAFEALSFTWTVVLHFWNDFFHRSNGSNKKHVWTRQLLARDP